MCVQFMLACGVWNYVSVYAVVLLNLLKCTCLYLCMCMGV